MGTYLHGLFASDEFRRAFLGNAADADVRYEALASRRRSMALRRTIEKHLDLDALLALASASRNGPDACTPLPQRSPSFSNA